MAEELGIKAEVRNGKLKVVLGGVGEYNSQALGYDIDLHGFLKWYEGQFGAASGPAVDEVRHQLQASYFRQKKRKNRAPKLGQDSSHYEVAEAIRKDYHFEALSKSRELLVYQEGVYVREAGGFAASLVERIKEATSTNGFVSETLGHLERTDPKNIEDFDADSTKVNLQNGILDLKTFGVTPHSPDYLSFTKLNAKYDKGARCPTIVGFIDEAHESAVDKLHDIDFMSACLYNKQIKKSKLDIGDTDSGKTTYQLLVEALLGSENVCHISPQELENDRFIAYNAVGKAAILYGDVDKRSLDKSTKFKTTTGGDRISVQRKHGQPFDVGLRAKGIYAANVIPETKDESDAFFNRWLLEFWPYIFRDDGKYCKNEEGHLMKVNDTKKDPFLIDRMTTEEELSGLLNVCLRRLPLIVQHQAIPYASSIEETRLAWLVGSDFERLFVSSAVVKTPDGEVERQPLYMTYHKWCGWKGVTPKTQRTFNNRIEHILGAQKLDTTREGKDAQLWKGIAWKKNMLEIPAVPPAQSQSTGETGGNRNVFSLAESEWDEIKAAFGEVKAKEGKP